MLIAGGVTADGTRPADEVFRLQDQAVVAAGASAEARGLSVAESLPANGSREVVFENWVSVRFSRAVDVSSVNAATITMRNGGPVAARVVGAEGGMLAFVTPIEALQAGAEYFVLLSGVRDANGFPLPNTEIGFTTAAVTQAAPPQQAQPPGPKLPPKEAGCETSSEASPPVAATRQISPPATKAISGRSGARAGSEK